MLPQKPRVFISAVTSELSQARETVARIVRILGYEAVYQTEFITQPGKLLDYLRELIDKSELVIQLVGDKYGAEPRQPPQGYERCSYTQFELLYAEKKNKKILVVECGALVRDAAKEAAATSEPVAAAAEHPEGADTDAPVIGRDDRAYGLKQPPDDEQRKLQADYLDRIKQAGYKREKVSTPDGLENTILKLRNDLRGLWKKYVLSMAIIYALLLVVLGVGVWSLVANRRGFGRVEQGIGEVKQGVGDVKQGVGKVQEGVTHIGQDVVGVKEGVAHIDEQVGGVREGVTDINSTLKGPTGVNGRLLVKSDPPGATAFLQREHSMPLPLRTDLPHGVYSFSFNLLGYEPEFRDVTIQSGEITDLGTIHLQPLRRKFDADATYIIEQVSKDPYTFLDREFWVRAQVDEDVPHLDLMTAGEGVRYRYIELRGVGGEPARIGMIILPVGSSWAIGRMPPDMAEKFLAALKDERDRMFRRDTARNEAYLQKVSPQDRSYVRSQQRAGNDDPEARIKIRLASRTYSPGGLNRDIDALKFLCDIVDWDFAEADKKAETANAAAMANATAPKLVITPDDTLGQALFGDGSESNAPPAQTVSGSTAAPTLRGGAANVLPAPAAASAAALKADAKAADNELNAAYGPLLARLRKASDQGPANQFIAAQKQWLAARDRITDPAGQIAFVRARAQQFRQLTARFDQQMKAYDAAHR